MHIVIRLFITCLLALIAALHVVGQQLQVIDKEGNPIAYVCVTDANGILIGTTDLEGRVADLKGITTVNLTHVAYRDTTLNTGQIVNNTVTLNDIDFSLPEVEVKPKELIYVQTYFRLIYIFDEGPVYFRGGVIDNVFDLEKKEVKTKDHSLSKGQNGFIRFLISTIVGKRIDELARLPETPMFEQVNTLARDGKLTLSGPVAASGRVLISDSVSQLGYIDSDHATRAISIDRWAYRKHIKDAEDRAKGKQPKKDDFEDSNRTFFESYRVDPDGRSTVADFVMRQINIEGKYKEKQNYILLFQSYNTDVNYIDKKEYKQLRKENKVDMNINELRLFEKAHNIPPLAPDLQAAIDKLFAK